MDNDDVRAINAALTQLEYLKTQRSAFEQQWNEIIDRILPRHPGFNRGKGQPGTVRSQRIYDATAQLAMRHFAAAMDSMITPRTQVWHRLATEDDSLEDNQNVKQYLDAVTKALFTMRYRWRAGFTQAIGGAYLSIGSFGAGAVMIEDAVHRRGARYRYCPLQRLYYSEGEDGIDKAFMLWPMTIRQAAERFGRDNLPQSLQNLLEREPEKSVDFLHVVQPRKDRDPRKLDGMNMRFESLWISLQGKKIVQRGGFRTFPVGIGRFYVDDDSQYGSGPAGDALPDIAMVNEMERTNIKGAQKAVDPPLLLPEDGALEGFDLRSGGLNYGGLDDKGNELVKALQTGGRVDLGIEYTNQKRESINLAFYVTLFQILVDNPQMTATEVLQRAQEKGVLLAPPMGRVQSEMLGPTIERELDIAFQAGLLPQMPQELIDAGGSVTIDYDSPLNRAMRAQEGTAVLRWAEASAPFIQADPRAAAVPKAEAIVRGLADVFSVPAKYVNSEDDVEQAAQQQAQQQQAAALLEAAPVAAGAAKDLADANATVQNARL
jgi:hypothetical protein